MKLLLADHNRDFLITYNKVLEYEGFKVTPVFDGIQAIMKISGNKYDIVLINDNIPRVNSKRIIRQLNSDNIPSLVFLENDVTPMNLLDGDAACSYMSFPFFPSELSKRIKDILDKSKDDRIISFESLEINISHFLSDEGIRFTNEEIDILEAIYNGDEINDRHISAYVNALNNKLEKMKKNLHIKYILDHGYRLVNMNE